MRTIALVFPAIALVVHACSPGKPHDVNVPVASSSSSSKPSAPPKFACPARSKVTKIAPPAPSPGSSALLTPVVEIDRSGSFALDPTAKVLVIGGATFDGRSLLVLDAVDGALRFATPIDGTIAALTFSDDGRILVAATGTAITRVDLAKGRVTSAPLPFAPHAIAFSPEENRVIVYARSIVDLDAITLATIATKPSPASVVEASANGAYVGWADGKRLVVREGDVDCGSIAHPDDVVIVRFSANDDRVLTIAKDSHLRVFDLSSGAIVRDDVLTVHDRLDASLSRDGDRLFVSDIAGSKMSDFSGGTHLTSTELLHASIVGDVMITVGDAHLERWDFSGNGPNGVRLDEMALFQGDFAPVQAWSPDVRRAISITAPNVCLVDVAHAHTKSVTTTGGMIAPFFTPSNQPGYVLSHDSDPGPKAKNDPNVGLYIVDPSSGKTIRFERSLTSWFAPVYRSDGEVFAIPWPAGGAAFYGKSMIATKPPWPDQMSTVMGDWRWIPDGKGVVAWDHESIARYENGVATAKVPFTDYTRILGVDRGGHHALVEVNAGMAYTLFDLDARTSVGPFEGRSGALAIDGSIIAIGLENGLDLRDASGTIRKHVDLASIVSIAFDDAGATLIACASPEFATCSIVDVVSGKIVATFGANRASFSSKGIAYGGTDFGASILVRADGAWTRWMTTHDCKMVAWSSTGLLDGDASLRAFFRVRSPGDVRTASFVDASTVKSRVRTSLVDAFLANDPLKVP